MKCDFADRKPLVGALKPRLPKLLATRVANNNATFTCCGKSKVLPRDDGGGGDAEDFDVRMRQRKPLRKGDCRADTGEGTRPDGEEDGGEFHGCNGSGGEKGVDGGRPSVEGDLGIWGFGDLGIWRARGKRRRGEERVVAVEGGAGV